MEKLMAKIDNISTLCLQEKIKKIFIEQEKYLFDKYIPEFKVAGQFLADCFSNIIVEPHDDNPPRFYHTFSPFDVISNAAPDHALVFEKGSLILNTDFAGYVSQRTGAMDTLIVQNIGIKSLTGSAVLYVGSGSNAQASLRSLKDHFPDLKRVDCINSIGDLTSFKNFGKEIDVIIHQGDLSNIQEYDFIFCHTAAKQPVLTGEMINKIKPGTLITTYISSTDHGEVVDEFYDTEKANVICDWHMTLEQAKDLKRSVASGRTNKADIITARELFTATKKIDVHKSYTIYRSVGTPMQNLAVLQLLLGEGE